MEKSNMGEVIISHYEKFLGVFEERRVFKSSEDMPAIQLLQYNNVFEGCKTYVSFGLSKFSEIIQNTCETVMVVDDDFQDAADIFANVLFYIVKNRLSLGRGTYVEGVQNINKEFAHKHNKYAVYFTEAFAFPDEFSDINEGVKMYLAFFISQEECNFIKKFGYESFEDYLEEKECDIMDLNR